MVVSLPDYNFINFNLYTTRLAKQRKVGNSCSVGNGGKYMQRRTQKAAVHILNVKELFLCVVGQWFIILKAL